MLAFEEVLRDSGLSVAELHGAGFPFFNLYRLAMVARGRALIDDAAAMGKGPPKTERESRDRASFSFSVQDEAPGKTRFGWQLTAVASRRRARGLHHGGQVSVNRLFPSAST